MSYLRLADDERYRIALERVQGILEGEQRQFRSRLAGRMVGLVSVAIDEMGDQFDEPRLRKALAAYDTVFVEESLAYIRGVLVRTGEVELAKRLGEAHEKVGLEDLPADFQAAFEAMQLGGLPITAANPGEPSGSVSSDVG